MGQTVSFASLDATIAGLKLPNGLVADTVKVTSGPATVSTGSGSFESEQPGTAVVSVSEASLRDLVQQKAAGVLTDVKVTCANGIVTLTGTASLVFAVAVTVACKLQIRDGSQLHVVAIDASPALARGVVAGKIAEMNPVFDTDSLPLACRLSAVTVADGFVRVEAAIGQSG